ncbi:hypothetical protein AURDEDRAFT_175289 [Auricularia subglabra TFB-10046 SS5]|uniref:Sc15 protein n=1 Tax=Auricularia subglabra (strain TFB-10046 / SS5) TaxID=717982 RepID=J0WS42_AURST|nr:hypothetical protein AURDEDRAFT_175289 [Auricularia subglabra TFB-10046 SS5]
MRFSRIAAAFLALVPLAFASPAANADNSDIIGVLQTLQKSTQTILPQITQVAQDSNKTHATEAVKPLIDELTAASNTAVSALEAIQATNGATRPADPAVANLASSILSDITTTLNSAGVSSAVQPNEIIALDDGLSALLGLIGALMRDAMTLVATSVVGLAGFLLTVGLGLVLAGLGL